MSECQQATARWNRPKSQYLGPNPYFLPDDPPWFWHYSMQNLILHPAHSIRTIAHVYERMSAGNTRWNHPKSQYLGPNPYFLPDDPPWNWHYSMQNLILHPAQLIRTIAQVYERMSAGNTRWNRPKSQYLGPNPYFLPDDPPWIVAPFDAEFNSASSTTN